MIWEDLLLVVIAPIVALVGVILGSFLTHHWGLRSQIKISEHRERQRVFSQLMGIKFIITQLYVSRFEALIYSDYHEVLWKQKGALKESLDLQESLRWMRKSEELVLEIARNNQKLFESIGLIRILFQNTSKLDELSNRLYRFKTPIIKRPSDNLEPDQLESWQRDAVKQLQELVKNEYGKHIDALLDYLASQL